MLNNWVLVSYSISKDHYRLFVSDVVDHIAYCECIGQLIFFSIKSFLVIFDEVIMFTVILVLMIR